MKRITAFGETKTIKRWLLDTRTAIGLDYWTLFDRLKRMEPEKALTKPIPSSKLQKYREELGRIIAGFPINQIDRKYRIIRSGVGAILPDERGPNLVHENDSFIVFWVERRFYLYSKRGGEIEMLR